jgi:hypothetical protein
MRSCEDLPLPRQLELPSHFQPFQLWHTQHSSAGRCLQGGWDWDLMHVAVAVDRVETASLVRWLGLCPVWDQNGGQASVYLAANITNTVCKLVWFLKSVQQWKWNSEEGRWPHAVNKRLSDSAENSMDFRWTCKMRNIHSLQCAKSHCCNQCKYEKQRKRDSWLCRHKECRVSTVDTLVEGT